MLNSIAWELMVLALRHLALCSGLFGDVAEETHEAGMIRRARHPLLRKRRFVFVYSSTEGHGG